MKFGRQEMGKMCVIYVTKISPKIYQVLN